MPSRLHKGTIYNKERSEENRQKKCQKPTLQTELVKKKAGIKSMEGMNVRFNRMYRSIFLHVYASAVP